MRVTRNCLVCGTPKAYFDCPSNRRIAGFGRYCSRRCLYKARRTLPRELRCQQCNRPFLNLFGKVRKYCSLACRNLAYHGVGRPHTEQSKQKISEAKRGKRSPGHAGSNNSHWKGGVTPIRETIRRMPEYKQWRLAVFERDEYTCLVCGARDVELNADHIKPFSVICDENDIRSTADAAVCRELWDITNGRTLCVPCHLETDTHGAKVYNYAKETIAA